MSAKPEQPADQNGQKEISAHVQARILAEALPHLIRYDEQTVVIKFGGHAMGDQALADAFAKDIVYLKLSGINPIVVHGGGPQIGNMLKKLEIKSEFVHGLRVTDKPTVEIVEMVLAGAINKEIVSAINRQGGKAVGISGKDANLMIARRITELPDPESNIMKAVDIGYVGDPDEVNPHIVEVISKSDLIPVIAPIAMSKEGQTLNVNADTFASALAARMKAKRLLLLTDVAGVLDKDKKLISKLTIDEARAMIRDGTITGGMIPKIEGCIEVVEAGVEGVAIIDGRVPHCVLLELFTEHGVGTLVERSGAEVAEDEAADGDGRHARLSACRDLDLRSRQHALSVGVPAVHRRSTTGWASSSPACSACRYRAGPASAQDLLPPVRHDADRPDEGAQDRAGTVPRLRARYRSVGRRAAPGTAFGDRAAARPPPDLHQRLAQACRAGRGQGRHPRPVRGHLRHRGLRVHAQARGAGVRPHDPAPRRQRAGRGDVRGHAAQSRSAARARHDDGAGARGRRRSPPATRDPGLDRAARARPPYDATIWQGSWAAWCDRRQAATAQ